MDPRQGRQQSHSASSTLISSTSVNPQECTPLTIQSLLNMTHEIIDDTYLGKFINNNFKTFFKESFPQDLDETAAKLYLRQAYIYALGTHRLQKKQQRKQRQKIKSTVQERGYEILDLNTFKPEYRDLYSLEDLFIHNLLHDKPHKNLKWKRIESMDMIRHLIPAEEEDLRELVDNTEAAVKNQGGFYPVITLESFSVPKEPQKKRLMILTGKYKIVINEFYSDLIKIENL